MTLTEFWNRYSMNKENLISLIKKGLRYGIVYTHSGKEFHADEVFALALLEVYRKKLNAESGKELYPQFRVFRGRDIKDSRPVLKLDVDETVFDHHMPKEIAAFRENGIQYATAGLLWAVIGDELVTQKQSESMDIHMFQPLDAIDNGIGIDCQYSDIISSFVPNWNEDLSVEIQMAKAVDFAITILERKFANFNAIEQSKELVKQAYDNAIDKRIIILPRFLNWEEILVSTEALFVIWENDNQYCCQAVPVECGSFELKNPFLTDWQGLRNEKLCEVSKLDLVFCHSNGFYLVANTLEAALNACRQSI